MTGGGLGGGVIFVVAALLWAAVLVPAWMRRREFRAAERNALRLQRTLRVLAETAEVPQEVRLEATAKQALAHEKLLRTAQRRQEAEREAELAEARAEQVRAEIRAQEMRRKQAAAQRSARLRRPVVRRLRALAALVALGGVVGVLVGAGFAVGGNGPGVLGWSAALAAVGTGALVLLAPGRTRVQSIPAEHLTVPEPAREPAAPAVAEAETAADPSVAAAAHAEAQQAAAARIERARALARARAVRPAARENQTDSILLKEAREQVARARAAEDGADAAAAPLRPAQAQARPDQAPAGARATAASTPAASAPAEARNAEAPRRSPSAAERARQQAARDRLSRMGVIGDTSEGMPDLDAALRRRRNVG